MKEEDMVQATSEQAAPAIGHLGSVLDALRACDEQITAIHGAFGAPGNWGYETHEGKALYALYKFQADLRAIIRNASSVQ